MKIGISGYGRIGRNVHRMLLKEKDIDVVAINSRSSSEMRAHLLKYDTLHGQINNSITAIEDGFFVDNKFVKNISIKDSKDINWDDYDVDVVLESSGLHKTKESALGHFCKKTKSVVVSAPMKDNTKTLVFGVNEDELNKEDKIISNASCTTNCIAPVLKIISDQHGIDNVFVTSIHSFTNSQNLLDNSGRDFRRARSTTENIIPTTTGSIKATSQIIPELKGKIDGLAFRVPTPTVSICDVRLVLQSSVSEKNINDLIREKSKLDRYKNIIEVCDKPLVSADFITNSHSSILDTELTKVVGGKYVQLQLWYDNEWGYAARLIDLIKKLQKLHF